MHLRRPSHAHTYMYAYSYSCHKSTLKFSTYYEIHYSLSNSFWKGIYNQWTDSLEQPLYVDLINAMFKAEKAAPVLL